MSSAAAAERSVLILTAESPLSPGGPIIRQAITSTLHADGLEPLDVYEETIDATRFASPEYDAKLAALYRAKYGAAPLSLVITIGEPALDFALRHHDQLFRNVRILSGLMNERDLRARNLPPDTTRVSVSTGVRATIEIALALHPGTRRVVVIGGASAYDRGWTEMARVELRPLESRVSLTYVPDLPLEKLIAEMAALSDDALMLFLSMTLDGEGVPRVAPDVIAALRRVARVPIYGMASTYLGRGIVGGVMVDMRGHGIDLALRARDILSSHGATNLPLMTTANLTAFDGRELRRFGVAEARLPTGATVTNPEISRWDAYKWTVLVVGAVLAAQFALIGGLLVQAARRRRAELALQTLSGRLLSAQEEERRRIARELHDSLSQQIALLAIEIEQVAAQPVRSTAVLARSMSELSKRTAEISTEIHNMSHRLHSSKLDALGLAAAMRGHCHEVLAQGVQVEFSETGMPEAVSRDVQLCLFRIVQESLNNVVKHSGAREAHVTLVGVRDALVLSVADLGHGFDEADTTDRDGLGLASMRERLRLIGGELTISSRSGYGTTIEARVPLTSPRGQKAFAQSVRVA